MNWIVLFWSEKEQAVSSECVEQHILNACIQLKI